MAQEMVKMSHPDLPGDQTSTVPKSAFESHWKSLGWKIVNPSKKNKVTATATAEVASESSSSQKTSGD